MNTTLLLDEGERQVVLMALAHLAVERPGWDALLSGIAKRIDSVDEPTIARPTVKSRALEALGKVPTMSCYRVFKEQHQWRLAAPGQTR